jgi:predicted SAM-dependent methyltransferase
MGELLNHAKIEFDKYLRKWAVRPVHNGEERFKNGIDVGCGTTRINDRIISIDIQPDWRYANAQLVWDCKDLDVFSDNSLEFIFSSHCLEDFDNIPDVFFKWWGKLKPDGLMLLLLPDIEAGRYKKCGEAGGNPSHKTDVGKNYIHNMLETMKERGQIKYEILQEDTIPHTESSSIDFVIKKVR